MKRHNLSHEPGDALDELILDARAELDETSEQERGHFGPDFAAVVEEAHARDPQRVSRAARDEALSLAPVVVLGAESSQRMSLRGQAEFAALLSEARSEIAADAALQRPRAWPALPVQKASHSRTRRWLWATAAAAAAILALASPILATRYETAYNAASQAPWWQHAGGSAGVAPFREPVEIETPTPRSRPQRPTDPEPIAEPIAEPAPSSPASLPVSKTRKSAPASTATAETLSDQLRRLGGEAEAAWQSGDYSGAERLHRQVITLAPGSRAADLSYGDLFTLARQRSGPAQEQALWHEYLAAFPHGRYADDARAGLCRRSEADERSACWQQYLHDFPAGVHRPQAQRALAEP